MPKEEAPPPKRPPVKRRALERALDSWLAVWANDEGLTAQERARAQEVRDARKQARPDNVIGLLLDAEGITPEQRSTALEKISGLRPTEIHHPYCAGPVHTACKQIAPVTVHQDVRDRTAALRNVVLASNLIIAAPRTTAKVGAYTPAWEAIRFSRHRRLPVTIIFPDGKIEGEV